MLNQNIFPFGSRIARDTFGDTRAEQLAALWETVDATLSQMGMDPSTVPQELRDAVAASVFGEALADEEEGIPILERPRAT